MTTEVQGSILLRKLKTGQTAQISISTTKQLFQLYTKDGDTVTCVPSWEDNPVECSVNVVGSGVTIDGVTWYINDTPCTSMDECSVTNNVLTIKGDLVKELNYTSGTLKAVVKLSDGKGGTPIETVKTEPIRIQQATQSGYIVMVDATQTWVDASHSAKLTASVYSGTTPQTIDGTNISVKWFAGNTSDSTKGTGSTLTVKAGDVNGSQLFVCRAYSGGTEVDAEGVTIIDNSDEYHIAADVTMFASTSDTTGTTQKNATSVNVDEDSYSAKVAFKVLDTSGNEASATNWKCRKYHADTMKYISGSSASASYTSDTETDNAVEGNTITVYDGDYTSNSGGANHATEVICDAECEIA